LQRAVGRKDGHLPHYLLPTTAYLLTNVQELSAALAQRAPRGGQGRGLIVGLVVERLGAAGGIHLDELHQAVHPGRRHVVERRSPQSHYDLGPRAG
jgi:hypothetical protein